MLTVLQDITVCRSFFCSIDQITDLILNHYTKSIFRSTRFKNCEDQPSLIDANICIRLIKEKHEAFKQLKNKIV